MLQIFDKNVLNKFNNILVYKESTFNDVGKDTSPTISLLDKNTNTQSLVSIHVY